MKLMKLMYTDELDDGKSWWLDINRLEHVNKDDKDYIRTTLQDSAGWRWDEDDETQWNRT